MWCDNRVDCYSGVDEMYCTEEEREEREEKEEFPCYSISTSLQVCDGNCDCYFYCEDELERGGYNYHYWYTCSNTSKAIPSPYICDNYKHCRHGDDESNCEEGTCIRERSSTRTYKLANYSRCTPWVMV